MAITAQENARIREELWGIRDSKPRVRFFDHPVKKGDKWVSATYIELKPTGSDLDVRDYRSRAAKESDYREYPAEYERYKAEKDGSGTPLAHMGLDVAQVAELQEAGVTTVQQLAQLGHPLSNNAQRFLEAINAVGTHQSGPVLDTEKVGGRTDQTGTVHTLNRAGAVYRIDSPGSIGGLRGHDRTGVAGVGQAGRNPRPVPVEESGPDSSVTFSYELTL